MSLRRWLCFAVFLVAGCGDDDGVTLLVDLRTDYRPTLEFASARTDVLGTLDSTRLLDQRMRGVIASEPFLEGVSIAEFDGLPAGQLVVRVTLLTAEGREVASRTARLTADSTTGVTIVITRDCEPLTCPGAGDPAEAVACVSGRCVPPECTVENPAACGEPACTADTDCSAASACTTPRCSDGVCFVVPDDGLCGAAEICDPGDGCVPDPTADASVDASVDAPDGGDATTDGGTAPTIGESIGAPRHGVCALVGGVPYCWGRGDQGQLGDGTTVMRRSTPGPVTGLTGCVSIDGGGEAGDAGANGRTVCALHADGQVYCWGRGDLGQLGNGLRDDSSVPVMVSGMDDARALSVGGDFGCAIRASGELHCWGDNSRKQLGNLTAAGRTVPGPASGLPGPVDSVDAGAYHACALIGTETWCWGTNGDGQAGVPIDGIRDKDPALVMGAPPAAQVSAGGRHSCLLSTAGEVWCWGINDVLQRGDSDPAPSSTPTMVAGISGATSVMAGHTISCAITSDGTLLCWGEDEGGELGAGLGRNTATPTPVPVPLDVLAVEGSAHSACAVLADRTVWCWGLNSDGQLGDDTFITRSNPAPVVGLGAL